MINPKVGVVVLNYKTYLMTIDCVNKLNNISYSNFFIVVVDNASPNESREILQKKYQIQNNSFEVYFISADKNGGYSYGNNLGAKKAEELGAEYIIIMNNDVEIVSDNFIDNMIELMRNNLEIAMVGPGVIEKNMLQLPFYKNRPSGMSDTIYNLFLPIWIVKNKIKTKVHQNNKNPQKVYSVAGCCLALRTKYFNEVGYFDENVFLYGEEMILGEKFYKKNYSVYYLPGTKVDHKHSYTISKSYKNFQQYVIMEKSILYYYQNYRQDINQYLKFMIKSSGYFKIKVYIPVINKLKHYFYKI